MRSITIIVCSIFALNSFAQTIDFGLDFKVNQNFYQNRDIGNPRPYYSVATDYLTDSVSLAYNNPIADFSFKDDYGDTVNVKFTNYRISNNIEFPLYMRYTSKKNWFVDLKYSTTKYTIDYTGDIFQHPNYYMAAYGDFDDYVTNYGGAYNGVPVNGNPDETYNDTTAFINWFSQQVRQDPWSQASVIYQEEFKLRSFYAGVGYKFLNHKTIHPYISGGIGYRSSVSSFKRKYLELDENYLGISNIRRDLSKVQEALPYVKKRKLSFKGDLGFEFYRYHLGFSYEYTINRADAGEADGGDVYNHFTLQTGFHTVGIYLGADLLSFNTKAKNIQNQIYQEEYKTLSSTFDKNRKWSLGFRVAAPLISSMDNYEDFTVIDTKDVLDASNDLVNTNWEALTFRNITKVNWTPTLHLDYRQNLAPKVDLQFSASLGRLEVDTEVEDFRTVFETSPVDSSLSMSADYSTINSASYRSSYFNIGLQADLYFTFWSNGLFDLKAHAGGGLNYLAVPYSLLNGTVGVNGSGDDVYNSFNTYYWLDGVSIFTETNTWYSTYNETVDLNKPAEEVLNDYEVAGMQIIDQSPKKRESFYGSVSAGVEAEFNRLLIGVSGELSLGKVDNILIKNYGNMHLNIGYLLFTKNRLNRQLDSGLEL